MLEGAVFRSFIVSDELGRFLAMGESPASGRLPHGGQPVLAAIAARAKARRAGVSIGSSQNCLIERDKRRPQLIRYC